MRMFTNDVDTIIAECLHDAVKLWEETTGDKHADYKNEWNWEEIPGDQELSISFVDNANEVDFIPDNCETITKRKGGVVIELRATATVDEWIAAHGRGFLCSSEW